MVSASTIAVGAGLAVLLGFPAAAATVATVRSANIVDGQVRRPDLGTDAVASGKVANNSLTGADILESSLGRVPDAATVQGMRVRKVFLEVDPGSGQVLSMAGLRIRYSCNNPGELYVYAKAAEGSGGEMSYELYSAAQAGFAGEGEEIEIASPNVGSYTVGHLQYFDTSHRVVTFEWTYRPLDTCRFVGTAIGG
jgi:hypothetical protein